MLIHEKLMAGQFLLDLKNDRAAGLLHAAAAAHSQQTHAALQQLHHHQHHHHQLPSPPMPSVKLDLYSAYAYQQQLQQQLIGCVHAGTPLGSPPTALLHHHHHHHHQQQQQQQQQQQLPPPPYSQLTYGSAAAVNEVLDLSRRCDAFATPPSHKTPSPTPSPSYGSAAPSPNGSVAPPALPLKLFYAAQAAGHPAAGGPLAALCCPGGGVSVKVEAADTTPPPPPPPPQPLPYSAAALSPAQAANNNTATPITAFTAGRLLGSAGNSAVAPLQSPAAGATTPTSRRRSGSFTGAVGAARPDVKATRPFKAFPRDPFVIAANFAAADVLLDARAERYTEYRKRVLQQIRNTNGGSRTVSNPKMRRTNSRSGSIHDGCGSSNNNSETEEQRSNAAEESCDSDSNAGNFDKMTSSTTSTTSSCSNGNENAPAGASGQPQQQQQQQHGQQKDAAYFERRRKNNAAAKKSRDRRRIKEDEIAIRAAYLERQNIELLCQIDALKAQLAAYSSKRAA